jgi:hypothetical protein
MVNYLELLFQQFFFFWRKTTCALYKRYKFNSLRIVRSGCMTLSRPVPPFAPEIFWQSACSLCYILFTRTTKAPGWKYEEHLFSPHIHSKIITTKGAVSAPVTISLSLLEIKFKDPGRRRACVPLLCRGSCCCFCKKRPRELLIELLHLARRSKGRNK